MDHVGPLPQLHLANHGLCYNKKQLIFLNSNWSTAPNPTELTAAMAAHDNSL